MLPRTIFEPEHQQFRDAARRFIQNEIGPHRQKWREQRCVDRDAYRKTGAQGFLMMWAPEEYGGAGTDDFRYEQIFQEENARYGDISFFGHLQSSIAGPYIGKLGSDEQKQRILPDAVKGEKLLAIAMTEPGAGSDLAAIGTRAERKGERWILNGSKTYISNGIQADWIITAARSGPGSHQIGLFIVEAGMPGFSRGRKLSKMGLDAQDTAELFFDNVEIPQANVIGDASLGFKYMGGLLATERLIISVISLAHAQAAFDLTLRFIKERRAFGKPLGALQHIRFQMAEMRIKLDAAQALVDQCVILANDARLTASVAAQAKYLCTDLEGRVIDECLQFHGGAGYMEEYRICGMYRDARISRIFGGANEIMKELVGRSLGLDERKMQ